MARNKSLTHAYKKLCFALLLCVATAIPSPAQTFTSLFSFDITDGGNPDAPLAQGLDGNFYGATTHGGVGGRGTVYRMASGGKLTQLIKFGNDNGSSPFGGLVQAPATWEQPSQSWEQS